MIMTVNIIEMMITKVRIIMLKMIIDILFRNMTIFQYITKNRKVRMIFNKKMIARIMQKNKK